MNGRILATRGKMRAASGPEPGIRHAAAAVAIGVATVMTGIGSTATPAHAQQKSDVSAPAPPPVASPDSISAAVDDRLRQGFTWTTARELARRLSIGSSGRSVELVLLTARAHAAAGSWTGVRRLLAERDWLDSAGGGEGRILLAKAGLALGDPESAVRQFESVGQERLSPAQRVHYATALAAVGREMASARQYLRTAVATPAIAAWLKLSAVQSWAAAGMPDSARAAAAGITNHPIVWPDSTFVELARAYFMAGDTTTGMAFTDSLTRRARARLAGTWLVPALLAAGDTAGARHEAESALRYRGVDSAVGEHLLRLDASEPTLLRVAAVELRESRPDRAAELLRQGLEKAAVGERSALTLRLAEALFAARRYAAVSRLLEPWVRIDDRESAAAVSSRTGQRMRFLAGRALYRRGFRDDASKMWEIVASDATAPDGGRASYLLADIRHDRGRLAEARAGYEATVTRFPRSEWAALALIRLGMIDLVEERPASAAARFDTYRRRFPGGSWYSAATFWAARARDAAGDSARSLVLYRQVLGEDPIGYYGIRAARSLGEEPWDHLEIRATPDLRLRDDHAELVRRMRALSDLGWRGRALRELSARDGPRESRDDRLALALALNEAGFSWQGTSIAWGVFRARSGIWSRELLRAVFPLTYDPVLRARASAEKLDPALVAAIVRRESQFDRDVVSRAGATGLMQVMPATAVEVARRSGIADFDPDQLTVPEVNLVLGSRYLRELLEARGGALVPALISYNAGPHRYAAWRRFPEFSASTELLIDRIPITETRRYVKAVLSYRYIYSRLYELASESG